MPWVALIENLRGRAEGRSQRLWDVLELDLEGRPPAGPLGLAHGAHYGDSLGREFQQRYGPEVGRAVAPAGSSLDDLLDRLDVAFSSRGGAGRPAFLDRSNHPNDLGPAPARWGGARAVRYIAIVDLLAYHLGHPRWFVPPAGKSRGEAALELLDRGLDHNRRHPGRKPGWLTSPLAGRVWVTASDSSPPHVATAGLPDDDACREVVRKMGLPGFEEVPDRREKIGLAALEYPLDVEHLYRPTVSDAWRHPYFFPAPRHASAGETCPLAPTLDAPGDRSEPGAREWIHRNREVAVLPKSEDENSCRVVWRATFREAGEP